jgi:3-oxoacyl-[acyl-carrier protein] reductase
VTERNLADGSVRTAAGLAGRTAVVTGTAHGIGAAIAAGLREDGAVVHGVDNHGVDKHVIPVPGPAGNGSGPAPADATVDLSDPAAVRDFFAALGDVDILVNNAGGVAGQVGQPLEDVTDESWQAVVAANLTTAFLCTRAVVPGMKRRGWGRIVIISSAAGLGVSKTGIQAYASAKAAQIGFTRQMAHELGPFGITVNCIAPGFILSNPTTQIQWDGYGSDGQAELVGGIAMRRLGQPADIANGVRFFAAERSSWVTGQTIAIDGGHAGL